MQIKSVNEFGNAGRLIDRLLLHWKKVKKGGNICKLVNWLNAQFRYFKDVGKTGILDKLLKLQIKVSKEVKYWIPSRELIIE